MTHYYCEGTKVAEFAKYRTRKNVGFTVYRDNDILKLVCCVIFFACITDTLQYALMLA